jgi:signal peptidase I
MSEKWKRWATGFWRNYARPFLFVAVILLSFRSSVADWNDVPTGSMKPSILEGDRIFVNKLAYDLKVPFTTWRLGRWADPQRGDIVVFFSPADGRRLVKRVVALPGDSLRISDGRLYLNGAPAQYGGIDPELTRHMAPGQRTQHRFAMEQIGGGQQHPIMLMPGLGGAGDFLPLSVPEGHYFVLGDNRDNSADSRFIGTIPRGRILGRASAVVLSLDATDHYLPRWGRFFTALP